MELDITDKISLDGIVQETTTLNTADGSAVLTVFPITRALNDEGFPLQNITLVELAETPHPPPNGSIVGFIYELLPEGATFSPPVRLDIRYDPASLPEGVDERNLCIAYYSPAQGWVRLQSAVYTQTHSVVAEVPHFTEFAILNRSDGSLSPVAEVSWGLMGGIMAAVLVILGLPGLFLLRRKKTSAKA